MIPSARKCAYFFNNDGTNYSVERYKPEIVSDSRVQSDLNMILQQVISNIVDFKNARR